MSPIRGPVLDTPTTPRAEQRSVSDFGFASLASPGTPGHVSQRGRLAARHSSAELRSPSPFSLDGGHAASPPTSPPRPKLRAASQSLPDVVGLGIDLGRGPVERLPRNANPAYSMQNAQGVPGAVPMNAAGVMAKSAFENALSTSPNVREALSLLAQVEGEEPAVEQATLAAAKVSPQHALRVARIVREAMPQASVAINLG